MPPVSSTVSARAFVREPKNEISVEEAKPSRPLLDRAGISQLGPGFWWVVVFGALLSLSRFSEAFLLLRGPSTGIHIEDAPILMVIMNLVYVLTAYPVGHLSDRLGRNGLLAVGIAVLVAADLVLAGSHSPWQAMLGVSLWGFQMGLTQGLLSAMVADAAPSTLRGTAFGLFNLACGIATLLASVIAGIAWESFGAEMTFITGAVLGSCALFLLGLMRSRMR